MAQADLSAFALAGSNDTQVKAYQTASVRHQIQSGSAKVENSHVGRRLTMHGEQAVTYSNPCKSYIWLRFLQFALSLCRGVLRGNFLFLTSRRVSTSLYITVSASGEIPEHGHCGLCTSVYLSRSDRQHIQMNSSIFYRTAVIPRFSMFWEILHSTGCREKQRAAVCACQPS